MNLTQFLHPDNTALTPASLKQIEKLEYLIGVRLPPDYRSFLLEVGGCSLRDTLVECTVPTPFGEHVLTEFFSVDEVIGSLYSGGIAQSGRVLTPRNMISISYGHFGAITCLSIAGIDHGQVFSLDTEMRFFWDHETLNAYPHLDPSVRGFFRLRDAHELPERPWGYENCYHVADSFEEFVSKMYLA
jgi:hypothetical protein